MRSETLITGAVTLIIVGLATKFILGGADNSFIAIGLGLMWMGLAAGKNK